MQASLPVDPAILPQCFDLTAFHNFAPLLQACEPYARLTGCRFRRSAFDWILSGSVDPCSLLGPPTSASSSTDEPGASPADAQPLDDDALYAAKLAAGPFVGDYSSRLHAADAALIEEHALAFRICMGESVRNAMIATFQSLDIWPPKSPPEGIDEDDCAYEDVSAPIQAIAQRAYNDESRRLLTTSSDGVVDPQSLRAKTASFIVDFVHEVGIRSQTVDQTHQDIISEFAIRTEEYQETIAQSGSSARDAFFNGFGLGAVSDQLRGEGVKAWTTANEMREKSAKAVGLNKNNLFWGGVCLAAGGPVFGPGLFLAKKAWDRRGKEAPTDAEQPAIVGAQDDGPEG